MIRPKNTIRTALAGLVMALSPLEAVAINGDLNGKNGYSNGRLTPRSALMPEVTPFFYDPKTSTLTPSNYAEVLSHQSDLYRKIREIDVTVRKPMVDSTAEQVIFLAGTALGIGLFAKHNTKAGIAVSIPLTGIFVHDIGVLLHNASLQGRTRKANRVINDYTNPASVRNDRIIELREDDASDYELKREIYERIDELFEKVDSIKGLKDDPAMLRDRYTTILWRLKDRGPKTVYEDLLELVEELEDPVAAFIEDPESRSAIEKGNKFINSHERLYFNGNLH